MAVLHYIKSPDAWDFNDISSSGLNKGIEVILLSPNTITPYWVDRGSVSRFIQLRGELTKVIQAKEEIERFVQNEVPEDNQLAAAHKQAGKRAEKLQADLQTTCNALAAMTVEEDECFGDEFFSNLVAFIQETRKNTDAQDKVESLRNLLSTRGIVTHQTNIDTEQVKSQLPIFTGSSSLSIMDASDTWTKILKNSGVHRQVWGNIILGRIQDPALSNIPLSVKREAKVEEICLALTTVYGGAMKVSENIMNAHVKAGAIPDPHSYPEAALKVLRGHYEVMEHAARFIELSNDENAASEIMTGGNLTKILDLLPKRLRMTESDLEVAETDAKKRTV